MPTALTEPQALFKDQPFVEAGINYLSRSVKKPYVWVTPSETPEGEEVSNQKFDSPTVKITDLKDVASSDLMRAGFSTEQAGFQFVDGFGIDETSKGWADEAWEKDEWIKETYYSDIDSLIKRELGVDRTFIFDHTVRKRREKGGE